MTRSSLLGIERSNPRAPGHDDAALGPSDSSDSGSDMTGLDAPDVADTQLPLDRALSDDSTRPLGAGDARGGATDLAGTGERRSAAGDDGGQEAGDIGVDQVFSPFASDGEAPLPEEVEAGLEASPVEAYSEAEDGGEVEEEGDEEGEEEDESADPVGDGRADALLAASLPPRPDRPNPAPDPAEDAPPGAPDDETPPEDEDGPRQPGRDPAMRRRS